MKETQTFYSPREIQDEAEDERPTSGCGIDHTDIDLLDEALDALSFCATALTCDEQTRWNRRADDGLSLVMFSALEKLDAVYKKLYEATRK